jgi:hypothetical protein
MNTNTDAAKLAQAVEDTLTTAGLTIATDDHPTTPNGWTASGVGVAVAEVDGVQVVMLTWGMSDAADYRTVGIMLAAVAEVLTVHGFAVSQHPVGLAYLVTGHRGGMAARG